MTNIEKAKEIWAQSVNESETKTELREITHDDTYFDGDSAKKSKKKVMLN